MSTPKRRWIAFTFFAGLAVMDLYVNAGLTWKGVAIAMIAAVVLLGAEYFDGIQAGPIDLDTESDNEPAS